MKPILLHISNDYPDPLRPDKTKAIQNLVEATPEFRHVVYSLNRVNGFGGIVAVPFGDDRTAVLYGALPKGILWKHSLTRVAEWIFEDLKEKNLWPDLIQAHKITVEGIIGLNLAKRFNCKLICDIQGGTDIRVLKVKRDLYPHFREIAAYSSHILPYAPWVMEPFSQAIGLDKTKCICLPVLPGFDTLRPSTSRNSNCLVTLMRFGDHKNKNLIGTVNAMQQLKNKYPGLALDVYGGGDPKDLLKLTNSIRKAGMADHVHFKGPIANNQLPETLAQYTALVMPSFMETYGLVYAEALFCGIPVMFSKGRAIDGYFDAASIGYACDPASADDMAKGMDYLLENEDKLKKSIAAMQEKGALDFIRRSTIITTYRDTLLKTLGRN